MTAKIPLHVLVDAAWEAGFNSDSVREFSYNARWYAKNCFGVVGNLSEFGQFLLEVARHPDGGRDYANALTDSVCTDSMGYDTIFYFPGIEPLEEDSEDEQ